MPIEIRELVVRVTVSEPQGQEGAQQNGTLSKETIQLIVNQVLEAIKQKKER